MSHIQLEKVCRRFGSTFAVRALDLNVASGEFISIVGGSGCGKTTTLRMIAGLDFPDSGEIYLDGARVNELPIEDRGVGIVFQSYALFPTMTVERNISFGLEMAKRPALERKKRVDEMLELVHLTEYRHRYPWQISGGQQQRVALARALAVSPKVLLLDEPLSALDARIRQELRYEVRRIQKSLGITAIYVTHDQEEALAIADRMVVMDRGMIQQVGTGRDVYDHPTNAFVAGFVGISNLLPVRWSEPRQVDLGGFRIQVNSDGIPGNSARLCLRPERLRLVAGASPTPSAGLATASGQNRLPVVCGERSFLGSSWRLECYLQIPGTFSPLIVDVPRGDEYLLAGPVGTLTAVVEFAPEDCVILAGAE